MTLLQVQKGKKPPRDRYISASGCQDLPRMTVKSCLLFVFQVVSNAADQGVAITGNNTFNNWNWPNAVIFAATVITTIGKYKLCCFPYAPVCSYSSISVPS